MVRLVMPPHFDKGGAAPLADLKTYQRLTDLSPEETMYEGAIALKNDGEAPMHIYSAESNTAFLTISDSVSYTHLSLYGLYTLGDARSQRLGLLSHRSLDRLM